MKKIIKHIKNFIYWIKKIMTEPLRLEDCNFFIKPQEILSVVLIFKKNGAKELLVTTTTSKLPLRVPGTSLNIDVISSYCPIYELPEEIDHDYIEIPESKKNEDVRRKNRKKLEIK